MLRLKYVRKGGPDYISITEFVSLRFHVRLWSVQRKSLAPYKDVFKMGGA